MHNEESYHVKCPKCFREMTSLNKRSWVMVRAVNSRKESWGGYVCCLCIDSMTMAEVVRAGNEYTESVFQKYGDLTNVGISSS